MSERYPTEGFYKGRRVRDKEEDVKPEDLDVVDVIQEECGIAADMIECAREDYEEETAELRERNRALESESRTLRGKLERLRVYYATQVRKGLNEGKERGFGVEFLAEHGSQEVYSLKKGERVFGKLIVLDKKAYVELNSGSVKSFRDRFWFKRAKRILEKSFSSSMANYSLS